MDNKQENSTNEAKSKCLYCTPVFRKTKEVEIWERRLGFWTWGQAEGAVGRAGEPEAKGTDTVWAQ